MKRVFFIMMLTAGLMAPAISQKPFTDAKVKEVLSRAELGTTRGHTATAIGKEFLGVPYVAKTLEGPTEKLVCRADGLDCYTFVESVVALTLAKYEQKPTLSYFQELIKKMRYRNGKLDGYGSRIHYFSEWVLQAQQLGILKEVTPNLPGHQQRVRQINFMSTHPKFYPPLADAAILAIIKKSEAMLSQIEYFEIPEDNFNKTSKSLREGDIVVFTTTVAGLDVNHEGFVTLKNGVPHLLHASLDHKKVVVSPESLADYLVSVKKHAGIRVLRLL